MEAGGKENEAPKPVRNGKTKGGKKQRYKSENGTFVVGDAREKKTNAVDKLLILLMDQSEPRHKQSNIAALFKTERQSISKLLKKFGSGNDAGIHMEIDMDYLSAEIFPNQEFKKAIYKEIIGHRASDWIMIKFPDKKDSNDIYLLKAVPLDSGEGQYVEDSYSKCYESSTKFQRIEHCVWALNGVGIRILQVINEHKELNIKAINEIFIGIPRSRIIGYVRRLQLANLIEKKSQPVRYCLNWSMVDYLEKNIGEVIRRLYRP